MRIKITGPYLDGYIGQSGIILSQQKASCCEDVTCGQISYEIRLDTGETLSDVFSDEIERI